MVVFIVRMNSINFYYVALCLENLESIVRIMFLNLGNAERRVGWEEGGERGLFRVLVAGGCCSLVGWELVGVMGARLLLIGWELVGVMGEGKRLSLIGWCVAAQLACSVLIGWSVWLWQPCSVGCWGCVWGLIHCVCGGGNALLQLYSVPPPLKVWGFVGLRVGKGVTFCPWRSWGGVLLWLFKP